MENSYGIGVRNRYELFYDEDMDPMDLLKQSEKVKDKSAEKENKGKTAKAKAPVVSKGVKTETPPKATEKTNAPVESDKSDKIENDPKKAAQQKGPRPAGNEGRVKFSDRDERNNRRNRPEGGERGEFREGPPPRFDGEGRGGMGRGRGRGRGEGRGRGRGRGEGRGGGPDGRGKREFDRQSGMATTGVKSVDKREGSGSYNWGSDKDQIEEQLNAPATNSDHDSSTENVEKPAEETTAATTEGEEQAKEEESAKEMTLDEWKALQNTRNKPQFNIRRAGEGENQAQWKKTFVLKKKEGEDEDQAEEVPEEEVHHGRRKVLLDIDFQFADSPSRGRGRGRGRGGMGRGRGRGDGMERGGGRGGPGSGRGERREGMEERGGGGGAPGGRGRGRGGRGGQTRQEAPKMDDERDFPSLG